MKKIQLGGHYKNGRVKGFALVDDEDFEFLSQWNWHLNSTGYAVRGIHASEHGDGNSVVHIILMHRVVNNTPEGFHTDHINRNKLDNRKSNLRTATASENLFNRGIQKNNKSGYNGVCWKEPVKKWSAQIMINRKSIHIGYFENVMDAVSARAMAEGKLLNKH